uniref:Uncharacterized protein n=1 Tax=Arundo donax TaxID=35708 RepID=A0A0A8YR05_ARUDO
MAASAAARSAAGSPSPTTIALAHPPTQRPTLPPLLTRRSRRKQTESPRWRHPCSPRPCHGSPPRRTTAPSAPKQAPARAWSPRPKPRRPRTAPR